MSAPQVGVVMPVLNHREDTLECLGSLAQATYPDMRVYVVDNGSTDGSAEAIAVQFPAVELVLLGGNRGFARASNVGIRRSLEAGAQYVLLLNNDTIIAPDMIDALVDAVDISSAAGILTPRIMFYGEDRVWSMGSRMRPLTLATLDFGRSRQPRSLLDRMVQVDSAVGCGMFVARPVFEQVGLLDEAFFLYYEDLDFSIRARKVGFELWVVPWARMWHKVSASTDQSRHLRFYYLARSSVRFYYKHTAGPRRWLMVPYRVGSACRFTLEHGLRGDLEAVRGYWCGLRDGLRDMSRLSQHGDSL